MFDFTSSNDPERIITIKYEGLQLVLEDYGYEYDTQLYYVAYMGFIVSINDYPSKPMFIRCRAPNPTNVSYHLATIFDMIYTRIMFFQCMKVSQEQGMFDPVSEIYSLTHLCHSDPDGDTEFTLVKQNLREAYDFSGIKDNTIITPIRDLAYIKHYIDIKMEEPVFVFKDNQLYARKTIEPRTIYDYDLHTSNRSSWFYMGPNHF
jgi:hypothetical protein